MSAAGYVSRPWKGAGDLDRLLQFVRELSAAHEPATVHWHVGDVIWALFGTPGFDPEPEANIRLWFDGDGLAGFAWVEPPAEFRLAVHPRVAQPTVLMQAMLPWAEERRRTLADGGDAELIISTWALDGDAAHIALLAAHGYADTERHNVLMRQSLDAPIPASTLPDGMHLRHATADDIEERVDVHRDAWSVWGPSSITMAGYEALRAAPLYEPELDIVLETADGIFASSCICWQDPATGIGEFEPVGTRPAFTGQGLARATVYEGLRRLRERGMHTATVTTASINTRALALYRSCGFEIVEREHVYVKRLGPR